MRQALAAAALLNEDEPSTVCARRRTRRSQASNPAWLQEHGISDPGPTFFVLEAVQFKREEDLNPLKHRIDALNLRPAMLFIDTFARSAVGVDENQAKDVGEWIDAVTKLQQEMGADVVALHHARKPSDDKPVRERGSSAFIGAVDAAIRLSRVRNTVTVNCEKQKDAEHFASFALALKTVSLGNNEQGQYETSCVLVPTDLPVAASTGSERRLNRSEQFALQVLTERGPLSSGEWHSHISAAKGTSVPPKTFQNWREALVTKGLVEQVDGRNSSYRVRANDESATASAIGTPLVNIDGPLSASHATPLKGVADGTGEALAMAAQLDLGRDARGDAGQTALENRGHIGSERSERPKEPIEVGSDGQRKA